MSNPLAAVKFTDLRRKVAWFFYGTRTFSDLAADPQANVDEIINDGYERFLNPPAIGGDRAPHQWGFLRPIVNITTAADVNDYQLPANFGGFAGKIHYSRTDGVPIPLSHVDVHRILAFRQRSSTTYTGYPTEYAVVGQLPTGVGTPPNTLMVWPTPDAAYTLKGQYFVIAGSLSTSNEYPACDAYHNQTLVESVLAVAEERLEDSQGVHSQNFLRLLASSVAYDKHKYAPGIMSIDSDTADSLAVGYLSDSENNRLVYNG